MSNISTAKSSLRAELIHVQSGLAYYQSRVEALSAAIHQLDEIGDEDMGELDMEEISGGNQPAGRRGRRASSVASATRKAGRPARAGRAAAQSRKPKGESRLPSTGGDFIPDLITSQRQTMNELVHAAAAKMPFKVTADELRQLRARLVAAVGGLLRAGAIRDEGKGRARVYFRD